MPRPSAAASRAGEQIQGFHPTVCGLPSAREWPKGHLLRPVLEQGGGHKIILPSRTV
jgi:hypothetical protein